MLTDTSVTGAYYASERGNHYCRKLRSVNQWVQSLILMGLRKEMRLQLALVVLTLNIKGTEVRTAAEVRTSHPGMGMGLKFSDLADSDRSHL
jgi:hypothetical protein